MTVQLAMAMAAAGLEKMHDPRAAIRNWLASTDGKHSTVVSSDAREARAKTVGAHHNNDRVESNFGCFDAVIRIFRTISVDAAAGMAQQMRMHYFDSRTDPVARRKATPTDAPAAPSAAAASASPAAADAASAPASGGGCFPSGGSNGSRSRRCRRASSTAAAVAAAGGDKEGGRRPAARPGVAAAGGDGRDRSSSSSSSSGRRPCRRRGGEGEQKGTELILRVQLRLPPFHHTPPYFSACRLLSLPSPREG